MLPLYDEQTEQHFFHLYDLLRRIGEHTKLRVIVEVAAGPVDLGPDVEVRVQRRRFAPLRACEMLYLVAMAVLQGHRTVYTHYSTFGGAASVLCRWLLGARALYWNCEENAGHFRPWRWDLATLRTKLKIEWPTAFVIKNVDVLVTGTPRMAAYYQRVYGLGPKRVRVLPNSYDEARFFPAPADDALRSALGLPVAAPVAFFVHRIAPRKGSRDLPAIIAAAGEDVHWLVCGDGPDRAWLEAEVARLGFADRVHILGNVPNKDIADHYRLASLLVMPSRQEGFPRVLLEAQACGLPLVATDVGGVADVVGPLALRESVVARDDFDALAARVRALLAVPATRSSLAEEGLQNVLAFGREEFLRRFVEIVEETGRNCPLSPSSARTPTDN